MEEEIERLKAILADLLRQIAEARKILANQQKAEKKEAEKAAFQAKKAAVTESARAQLLLKSGGRKSVKFGC